MKKGIKFSLWILGIGTVFAAAGWGAAYILRVCNLKFRAWAEITFFAVMALLGAALAGGILFTLGKVFSLPQEQAKKRIVQKVLSAFGAVITLLSIGVFGSAILFEAVFGRASEQVAEKYGQKMIAYEQQWLDTSVTYHEYKNFLVCGRKVLGREIYGAGFYTYEFYDTKGNLIARSEDAPSASRNEEGKKPNAEASEREAEEPQRETLYDESVVTDEEFRAIQAECAEILSLYENIYENAEKQPSQYEDGDALIDQACIDAVEDILIQAGYPVMNSDSFYPAYLENSDGVYDFWKSVESGKEGETAFWGVSPSGGLYYRAFQFSGGKPYCIIASTTWDKDGNLALTYAKKRELLNWDMTFGGDFYYQPYPTDRHWDAATLLRLKPVDKTLYDWNEKCIMPVGYHMVNLFLCDWTASNYGDLCFNDLYEYLYRMENGTYVYSKDYEQEEEPYPHCRIPAEIFESTIRPYFDSSLDEFRERTLYDTEQNIYPWQEISASNIIYFPSVIPEVTEVKENGDGSITLTVNVMCLDRQTDCLFTHEVTIMPLDNERFKYLGNQITYTGQSGLPPNRPRIPEQQSKSAR